MTDDIAPSTARALAGRAPRYTSYPPATQFTASVGPDQALAWLGRVDPSEPVSIYVHIPFCRRLCWFCACRTQGAKTVAPLAPYLDALEREIALVATALPPGLRVGHLHLGGGTPTFLPPRLMARLFAMLDRAFPRTPGVEISVEVDPTELDDARLDALAAGGVTRASLGVQDFEPKVQAAIGRPQGFAQTQAAVDGLRARDIAAINLDLLYGLPHQTGETLARTIELALSLTPDRLALYGYAHVPWASKRQIMIREADLPGPAMRLNLTRLAAGRFRDAGYRRVGIDHFARPDDPMTRAAQDGTLRRNFQGYTVDSASTLIGLGASAISCLPQGFVQNASRTADWKARLVQGRLATVRGHALKPSDRLEGAVIERLLCDFTVDPARFHDPVAVRRMIGRAAQAWPDAARIGGDGILRLRRDARHIARMIAMEMDAYAAPEGRHSVAV
ncbi:oxygen-independent coproporphyrinogen III oxidase [Jannaschia donghaensis]|uniref:Coproporphyrinogen-III oxidase n=1 Tax=Jannaschia donghaensis TaxID=420998 RepID=A0A0M6YIK7_9RHOB|nr:oxygen-independent coproporphyrinogen III oxidase [Jannaschia donghaensis]CTQ49505.1 Oxygen-independent coproporphyrinogen-III oxidase [Jannaschia donghaensis]